MARTFDTTPDADAVQLALYRKMSASDRVRIGYQMSLDARAITWQRSAGDTPSTTMSPRDGRCFGSWSATSCSTRRGLVRR